MKRCKAQSTLEYVIILAAIIGAIVLVANMFKPKLVANYDTLTNRVGDKVNEVAF